MHTTVCVCVCTLCALLSHSVVSDSLWPHGLQSTRLLCPWGFSRKEYWSGLLCPPPGNLPNPGIKPKSPALQADSLLSESPGKPHIYYIYKIDNQQGPRNYIQHLVINYKGKESEKEGVCVCVYIYIYIQFYIYTHESLYRWITF